MADTFKAALGPLENPTLVAAMLDALEAHDPRKVWDTDEPACLNAGPDCKGAVEFRTPLSGTGKSFPRCDKHWDDRLDTQRGIDERYPTHAPADFDPSYAGESWDEDY